MESIPWIDYSSLSSFMTCPRQYFWKHILGLRSGSSTAIINGRAYHEAIATYHMLRMKGEDHDLAKVLAINALAEVMEEITEPDPVRNLSVARYTLERYFDFYKSEVFTTRLVEVPFAIDFGGFHFVGKIDRVMDSPWGTIVQDTKTTTIVGERWSNRTKPNLQGDSYTSAVFILNDEEDVPSFMLDVIPIHEDPRKQKLPFRVGPSGRSQEDVDNWIWNVEDWYHSMTTCLQRGYWPQDTERCLPLLGFSCEFIPYCRQYPRGLKEGQPLEIIEGFRIEFWQPFPELSSLDSPEVMKGEVKLV